MSGQNLWLKGTVCDLKTDRKYGFIRPVDNLPRNFNKNKDVYFSFHAVSCLEIEIGMEVCFYWITTVKTNQRLQQYT